MRNAIEQGGAIIEQQKEMQVIYTEIFYSAKDLLEKHGQLIMVPPFSRRMVFNHIAHVGRHDVLVEISSAGANLEKARKMFLKIQGLGTLEVRKKGHRGEEEFNGIEWDGNSEPNVFFLGGTNLDYYASGRKNIYKVYGYAEAIKQIRSVKK